MLRLGDDEDFEFVSASRVEVCGVVVYKRLMYTGAMCPLKYGIDDGTGILGVSAWVYDHVTGKRNPFNARARHCHYSWNGKAFARLYDARSDSVSDAYPARSSSRAAALASRHPRVGRRALCVIWREKNKFTHSMYIS